MGLSCQSPTKAGGSGPRGGQSHSPAHTQCQASDGKAKCSPCQTHHACLQKSVRRAGRSLGKARVHITFPPHTLFSDFQGLSRVLIHGSVRKPTDGTVLFLEEPGLCGGQGWDARMLENPYTLGKFLPMQKHKQSLAVEKAPCPSSAHGPEHRAKQVHLYTAVGCYLLTGKRR